MEKHELIRRAEDLAERCERTGSITASSFLTPAERYELEQRFSNQNSCTMIFHGGHPDCERTAAFFLPDYLSADDFDPAGHLCAIRLTAHFGTPGHRDYLGALLSMGVGREWVGDIWVDGDSALVFCLPSVQKHLLSIDRVGRISVTAEPVPLTELPAPERKTRQLSFTVMSPRLDAVTAGMFHVSRSEAARQIALGLVSVNYSAALKPDLSVREGDILSLRGKGKGKITGTGGNSRKGRLFVYAEIYE